LKGDTWNFLVWNTPSDAQAAAVKAHVFPDQKTAEEQWLHVDSLIRLADHAATVRDVMMHYWNLGETLRGGGGYDKWLETTGL